MTLKNTNSCPVVELDRQAHAAMDLKDAAEARLRENPETADRAAVEARIAELDQRVLGFREAQTYAIAESRKGLLLQMVELGIARDEGDDPKGDRLMDLIRQGIAAFMSEPVTAAAAA